MMYEQKVVIGIKTPSILLLLSAMLCMFRVNTIAPQTITEPMKPETESIRCEPIEPIEPIFESIGTFKLTAYCPCEKCCGKTDGITATGANATAGRTIAVDPLVIPYGTVVLIDGQEYIAEDCGGAIKKNRIDIFFDTHSDALKFGVKESEVFIYGGF